jgi:sugar phosphate isomerase/epimerase
VAKVSTRPPYEGEAIAGVAPRSGTRSYQFSLAHLTLLSQPPPELIEIAADAGYDFVGLRLIPFGLADEPVYAVHSDPGLLQRTRRALRDTGVRVLDMELARIYDGVDVKRYLAALTAGAELGVHHVLTSVWGGEATFVRDQFALLCEMAKPLGLTVDLEYVPYAQVRNLGEAAKLLSSVPRSNAGLCIDTLHFSRANDQVRQLAKLPREWFHYAQICDALARWPGDEAELRQTARAGRLFLGEGGIDVRAILAAMPEIPYSIELPNTRLLAELGPRLFARRCLETARRYLQVPEHRVAAAGLQRALHGSSDRVF